MRFTLVKKSQTMFNEFNLTGSCPRVFAVVICGIYFFYLFVPALTTLRYGTQTREHGSGLYVPL